MNVPTVKTYVLDCIEMATFLEIVMRDYFVPVTEGLYIEGELNPALVIGRAYFQLRDLQQTPLYDLDNIKGKGDITDIDGNVIVKNKQLETITNSPLTPIQGINIIVAYIEFLIDRNSAWSHNKFRPLSSYINEYIKPEYHGVVEIYEKIDDLLIDLKISISKYLGDNRWIMFFLRRKNSDIFIDQSIDYRIYDWTRRIESKDWV